MKNEFITIKIWKKTLTKLRLLSAIKEKSIVSVLHNLISLELDTSYNTTALIQKSLTKRELLKK